MKNSEILREAVKVLDGGKAWCQSAMAKTAGNAACSPEAEDACRFCAMGAIDRALFLGGYYDRWARMPVVQTIYDELDIRVNDHCGGDDFTSWNDEEGRTASEVIELMTETAKHFEERGE